MGEIKHPGVVVRLAALSGSRVEIIIRVAKSLRQSKVPAKEIAEFMREAAISGSHDALMRVCERWVGVK